MNTILRNILVVIMGLILGGIVNMAIVMISGSVIASPEGADVTTTEGLKASLHLFEPKHFLMPFLAHALGTLVGAILCFIIASTHKMNLALLIGAFFLVGGIINVIILPSPLWFTLVDLIFAYIPMAWFGAKLAGQLKKKKPIET
jgi:hypothetical protein